MALNPIVYTEKVVRSFLRYQLTTYPFADQRLLAQMRTLLSLDETRNSPLLNGPFVSLSQPFREGASVAALVAEGVFHAHMRERIPAAITNVYGHQEEAIRSIRAGHTTLVATGTGSGKSECFLYPIISKCLELRDAKAPAGISAVIVYPMNALAEDQLQRLRSLLAGTGIPFGMYVGKTPEDEGAVAGERLPKGSSRADYEAALARVRREKRSETVHPAEEVCSRDAMRTRGGQPRILLTNVKQLELLLTRQKDVKLFADARMDFLVFDEAHTFTGAQGAETACLIRRLRSFCGRDAQDTVCVATSATIADKNHPDAAREFAARFFGVPESTVTTVAEAYEPEVWASARNLSQAPKKDPALLLNDCVLAVEAQDKEGQAVRAAYRDLAGSDLPSGDWTEALHTALATSEIVFQLAQTLHEPQRLSELAVAISKRIGRSVSESEVLSWLTLGAAARKDKRPLLRPVVHAFIRGISGAVVSFPEGFDGPQLWLAAADELNTSQKEQQHAHFGVLTCTTCGQHYFTSYLKDWSFDGKSPEGGDAKGTASVWEPLSELNDGKRVVLIDRLINSEDDDDIADNKRTYAVHFCRRCGAAHPRASKRCLHCGKTESLVVLHAVRQSAEKAGALSSCVACGSAGHSNGVHYREPARQVKSTNVADVHVLAQDMVQHAERPRLLIFCDNRQDAAFQAGWMKDHARRFRLRALMAQGMANKPVSVGDLSLHLNDVLDKDESLSRALIPEVWQVARKEGSGGRHETERKKFLRIQVLREVTDSARRAIGLEPWGRMKVEYEGLAATLPWIQEQAQVLDLSAEDLCDGVAGVLDYLRRKRVLHDPVHQVFTKYWGDGDSEIQQGYLPPACKPSGTKLRREASERDNLVVQWMSDHGTTTIKQITKKWGVAANDAQSFIESLFEFLKDQKFLKAVRLLGQKGTPLPNVSGLFQVDADCLRLSANLGVWRCKSCRRRTTRCAPHKKCMAYGCNHGVLEFVSEDPDNYDLQVLDSNYSMLKPEEHTAMVPHAERERLENLFKGESDAINAFVCTQTLELGVDIGQLDSVLMRNVPPLPANYWQRAGRAGRRHRMAVNVTYCRGMSHDRAYFTDPLKLLAGRVDPPAFNLRNELMVAKHVHATMITRLHQYTRDSKRPETVRADIAATLKACLPRQITAYLFEDGFVRTNPFDLAALRELVADNVADLAQHVARVFSQGWPEADACVVSHGALRGHVEAFVQELETVVKRLRSRLQWCQDQMRVLDAVRVKAGTLDQESDSIFRRCDALVKRFKGTAKRQRRQAEGYDDVNTYGVLAAEGFLPGYGLEVGSVLGTAEVPFWRTGALEFALPRAPAVALREYVPGNLIYANNNKFVARRFHRNIDDQNLEMPCFEVSIERLAVKPTNAGAASSTLGSSILRAISVCDVDLIHQSHISDEEDLRFQLGVAVYGLELHQHNGGKAFRWGSQTVQHRRGVRLRLVNVGANLQIAVVDAHDRLGYPLCTVCGQSVSPLSSQAQKTDFETKHLESCGREVKPIGFYADVVADAFCLPACANRATAYSVLEALRIAATQVLDMHTEDLQILVIGHVDREEVDGLLWDPMPGGSGLLDLLHERFAEIVAAAKDVCEQCPGVCESACIDCLQTYRNAFYHAHLNRAAALECLKDWGTDIQFTHDIPPMQPFTAPQAGAHPVNAAEQKLRQLLLAADFAEGTRGEQVKFGHGIGSTTPDVIYRAAHHAPDEGIALYLDGMSQHLHGNAATQAKDREIREMLRNNGWEVITITAVELDDAKAMTKHFRRLAGYLNDGAHKSRIESDQSWFGSAPRISDAATRTRLRIVEPTESTRYKTCVPLVPLKAAAGGFGTPSFIEDGAWDWIFVDSRQALRPGMFVAQVVGKSMEPLIPDGSYCLFSGPVIGSRQGRVVLVGLTDEVDPETGERFTIKRYESKKTAHSDGSWRHCLVTLKPENPAFSPIVLTSDNEGSVHVVAEFVEVVG